MNRWKFKYHLSLLCLSLLGCSAMGQDIIPTKGTEFWVGFMENFVQGGPDEELNLFITSDLNTSGTVTIPQQGWSTNFNVTANSTTSVTIPNSIAEHFDNQIIDMRGVFVETQDTVAVFAINQETYTADGTKILPIQALGIEYRIASYQGTSAEGSEFVIVATEDGTEVEITPAATTIGGSPAGVPFTINLDAGQSYMVQAEDDADLIGSLVVGTENSGPCRPFAVFSGSYCSNVPNTCAACDHLFEQNFPVEHWGSRFFTIPFHDLDSYSYRVLAHTDGTTVTVDGVSGLTINAGEFVEYNLETEPHCIESSAPVAVMQFMQGVDCTNDGDPAMLILNDATQKIDNITFSTVESSIITSHNVTVIAETSEIGEVVMDGITLSPSIFDPIPSCPDHSYTTMPLSEGSHTLLAPGGITAYVYGTGNAESYTYSAGSFQSLDLLELLVDSVVCSDDIVTLQTDQILSDTYWIGQSNPTDTLGWGPTLTLNPPIMTDVYELHGNVWASGCEVVELFLVEANEPPSITLQDENLQICQYASVQLGVTPDNGSQVMEYNWSPILGLDDPSSANPLATPLETTTYTVEVSTPTGCGSATGEVTVEVDPGSITGVQATIDLDTICQGETVFLSANAGAVVFEDNFDPGVSWGLWCDIDNGTQSIDCGSAAGNALYFNGNGNRFATTAAINTTNGEYVSFALKVGDGVAPCDDAEFGENIVLEYSTVGCNGPFTEIQTFIESSYPQFTTVTVMIPPGAQSADTHFRWRQVSNSGDNQDNWAIDDVYVTSLDAAGYSFEWSPSLSIADPFESSTEANPTMDETYVVELTQGGSTCSYTDTIYVEVGQIFVADLTNDTTICDIQGVQLEALVPDDGAPYSWQWTPDDGTIDDPSSPTPVVTPTNTTNYELNVVSAQGCEYASSVLVTVNELLDLQIIASDTQLCPGEVANLEAIIDTDPATVTYEWGPDNAVDQNDVADVETTLNQTTTVTLSVTEVNSGCVLTDEIEIQVFDSLHLQATADTALCDMLGFQLEAEILSGQDVSWDWSPAGNLDQSDIANPVITLNESADFEVIATSLVGCSESATIAVLLLAESFELGPDVDLCEGDILTISTGLNDDYDHLWNTDDTTSEIEIEVGGTYSVTVTSPSGCEHTDDIEVTSQANPVLDFGGDQIHCEGETIELIVDTMGDDILWSNDETDESINVSISGTYWATLTNEWDCAASDTLAVFFQPAPLAVLPNELSLCEGDFYVLDAENEGATYSWNTAETTQTITISGPGIYTVDISNEFDCMTSDAVTVEYFEVPVVDLGDDISSCDGDLVVLDAGNAGLPALWSNGLFGSNITVSETGIYEVTVSNEACAASDAISVVFNPLPNEELAKDTTNCFLTVPSITIDAGNEGLATYEWEDGQSDQQIEIHESGSYSVIVSTPFGCQDVHTIYVDEVCPGALYIPNSFTPDGDGINDAFFAQGENIGEFHMEIWNRWGHLVWQTNDINEAWIGNTQGGEYYVDSETFVYVVIYKFTDLENGGVNIPIKVTGNVTLIR